MIDLSELIERRIGPAGSLESVPEAPRPVHAGPSWSLAARRAQGVRRGSSLLIALLAVGCGETSGPRTGAVELAATITGAELDPNGYGVAVDGGVRQAVRVNHTITLSGLKVGSHSVMLVGLPTHCTVSGANPRAVSVAAGATAQVAFSGTCLAATGTLAVRVVKSVEFDPNGYSLSLDGAAPEFVPALYPGYEQLTRFAGLSSGVHRLSISGVAAHCAASPPTPPAFTITAGTVTQVTIALVCATGEPAKALRTAR